MLLESSPLNSLMFAEESCLLCDDAISSQNIFKSETAFYITLINKQRLNEANVCLHHFHSIFNHVFYVETNATVCGKTSGP